MQNQILTLNPDRHVTLTVTLLPTGPKFPAARRRPAVLILPGGGYQYCSEREADPVAAVYLSAGYHTMILRYSVGEDAQWPHPLQDYEQAMQTILDHAGEWNVDARRIAVAGFSAGGHLAACAAAMSEHRPAAAILGYPVATGDVKGCNPSAPDAAAAVDGRTCPCFVFATCNDRLVPIHNSLDFLSALERAGISFESHIYAFGPHGFSTGSPSLQEQEGLCRRAGNWVADSIGWLRDVMGGFGLAPVCPPRVNDDAAPTYSLDCTMGCLAASPAALAAVRPVLTSCFPQFDWDGPWMDAVEKMQLRGALGFARLPQEEQDALDAALRAIPKEK